MPYTFGRPNRVLGDNPDSVFYDQDRDLFSGVLDSAIAGGFTGLKGPRVNLPDLKRLYNWLLETQDFANTDYEYAPNSFMDHAYFSNTLDDLRGWKQQNPGGQGYEPPPNSGGPPPGGPGTPPPGSPGAPGAPGTTAPGPMTGSPDTAFSALSGPAMAPGVGPHATLGTAPPSPSPFPTGPQSAGVGTAPVGNLGGTENFTGNPGPLGGQGQQPQGFLDSGLGLEEITGHSASGSSSGNPNPLDVFDNLQPYLEDLRDRQTWGAMSQAGFTGNRYGSSAQREAARVGGTTALEMQAQLSNLLYNTFLQNQQFALQGAALAPQLALAGNQLDLSRLGALQDFGMFEQGRADDIARILFDSYQSNQYGLLPLLIQIAGGGGQTPGLVAFPSALEPSSFDQASDLANLLLQFYQLYQGSQN